MVDLPKPNETAEKNNETSIIESPDLAPGQKGKLRMFLPVHFYSNDVLCITATDPYGREIYTWSWPVKKAKVIAEEIVQVNNTGKVKTIDDELVLTAQINDLSFKWDKKTGFLAGIKNKNQVISLLHGPIPVAGNAEFQEIKTSTDNGNQIVECIYKGDLRKVKWTVMSTSENWIYPEFKGYITAISTGSPFSRKNKTSP
jgi:hypothetical protein